MLASTANGLRLYGAQLPRIWVRYYLFDLGVFRLPLLPTRARHGCCSIRRSTDLLLERTVATRADLHGSRLITLDIAARWKSILGALLGLFHPIFGLGGVPRWRCRRRSWSRPSRRTTRRPNHRSAGALDRRRENVRRQAARRGYHGDRGPVWDPSGVGRRDGAGFRAAAADGLWPDECAGRLRSVSGCNPVRARPRLPGAGLNRQRLLTMGERTFGGRLDALARKTAARIEANGFHPGLRQGDRSHRA